MALWKHQSAAVWESISGIAKLSPNWPSDITAGADGPGRRYPYLASSQAGVALLETVKQADLPGLGARLAQGLSQGAGWKVPTLLLTGDSDKYVKVQHLPLHRLRPCPATFPLLRGRTTTNTIRQVDLDLGRLMVPRGLHLLDTALYLSTAPGPISLQCSISMQCSVSVLGFAIELSPSIVVRLRAAWQASFRGAGADLDRKARVACFAE